MPVYCFKDTSTDEVFEVSMSVKDLDLYKEQHPHHERYFDSASAPSLVSGVSVVGKVDDGFKEVLSKISEAHPGSEVADRHGRKSIKQVQTDRVIRKWRSSSAGP
jgi:hypothetical protein